MKTYTVIKPEIWYSRFSIKANSPEEAIKLIKAGEAESVDMEYSHDLQTDSYEVEEMEEMEEIT